MIGIPSSNPKHIYMIKNIKPKKYILILQNQDGIINDSQHGYLRIDPYYA
jgi:hypothetical protein